MKILKNFIYNFTYQILLVILPLITAPYVNRVLGAQKVGEYLYANSISYYFVLAIMLGLNNYGTRSIAIVRDDKEELSKTFISIYLLQFILAIIFLVSYIIYIYKFKQGNIVFLLQTFYVLSAMFDINWFFFGIEKFKLTVTRNIIIKVMASIMIFLFVRTVEDIGKYTLILSLSILISQLSLWVFLKKYIKIKYISINDVLKHIKPNIILFIPTIAVSIYRVMDKVMVGYLGDVYQVAYYENAEKLIMVSLGFINSLGAVMIPVISNKISRGDTKGLNKYFSLSMQVVVMVISGMAFGLAGISNEFIPIFYGKEFYATINILKILSISMFFIGWANVIRTQYLIPNKKDKQYTKSVCIGAITNFTLNIIFITRIGVLGAAIATIFTEAFVAIIQTFIIRKEINILNIIKKSSIYIPIGFIMYWIIRIIGKNMGDYIGVVFIQIVTGGVFYLISTLIYLYLTKNEILFIVKNKINKRYSKLSI